MPKASGSPRKVRSFSAISPEKTASECGVREKPIQPLLLSSARKVDRYRKSHKMRCPSASIRPRHVSSPIRLSPISRKNGLAPRSLKPALPELAPLKPALPKTTLLKPATLKPASLEPALLEPSPFERRLSSGNPWIQVSGIPSLGNHVAQTCTACPCGSPAHPLRPGFISKYRNHQAPLPSHNPSRKNQTSYRRRIDSAVNNSFSVFIRQEEYHWSGWRKRRASRPSPPPSFQIVEAL